MTTLSPRCPFAVSRGQTDLISSATTTIEIPRPRLRGYIHLVAALVSVAGLVWLVKAATTSAGVAVAWVYGISMVLLYGTSSTYHVFAHPRRLRGAFQRADHSMIYVLIAGTFTPMCVLTIGDPLRWWVLGFVWAFAIGGVVLKIVALERFPRTGAALYIGLGWCGLIALPTLWHRPALLALVFVGGVLYTVGAALFGLGRPRLRSRWFGYHELWHVFGVIAGALLFVVNLNLVGATPV